MASSSLLPYQKLIAQARGVTDSYERLKERFDGFADHVAKLSDLGPVPGVVVEKERNEPKFDVVYVGRRFRFELQLQINNEEIGIGVIRCSEVRLKEMKEVYQFTIDEDGDTNVKPSDSNEPICCDLRQAAWYLALNAMHEGLRRDL